MVAFYPYDVARIAERSVSWGWKIPVLCVLASASRTFGEMWSLLPGITPKALSDTLRDLESASLVTHTGLGNDIRYLLTEDAKRALPQIQSILGEIVTDAASRSTPEQFLHLQVLFMNASQRKRPDSASDAIRFATEEIRRLIASGAFRAGERLPSARQIAKSMHVTVSQAMLVYERLKAEGIVTTKPRAGTFASEGLMA